MTALPRKLIAGNWKMNGLKADGLALAATLAERARGLGDLPCDVLICPPATLLTSVADAVAGSGVMVGAQNCHFKTAGAFTGEIGAPMLADAGCSHVILGHSERRHGLGETDDLVRAKVVAAWDAGLTAIVCVGETAGERDSGKVFEVVARQLAGSLPDAGARAGNTAIAYEPVWAIGTGRTAEGDDIAAMHGHIRQALRGRVKDPGRAAILYGGSANPGNAGAILALKEVGGLLVGGASLDAAKFWTMIEGTSQTAR